MAEARREHCYMILMQEIKKKSMRLSRINTNPGLAGIVFLLESRDIELLFEFYTGIQWTLVLSKRIRLMLFA